MTVDKDPKMGLRDPSYRQFLATHFGLTKTGGFYRLVIGNERANLPDGTQANVVQAEIVMEYGGLAALSELVQHMQNYLLVKCAECGTELVTGISVRPKQGNRFEKNTIGPCPECGADTKWSDGDAFYGDGTPYEP